MNMQEAVLSAYIASIGKRTPRDAAQDAAELCSYDDLSQWLAERKERRILRRHSR
jgi:hypothetical protein